MQGSYQPKLYAGLSGGLTYKSFDFSIDLYSNIGNQVYNGKEQARVVITDNVEKSVATSLLDDAKQVKFATRGKSRQPARFHLFHGIGHIRPDQ